MENKNISIHERVKEINNEYAIRKQKIIECSAMRAEEKDGRIILMPEERAQLLVDEIEKMRILCIRQNVPEAVNLMDAKFTGIKSGFVN